MREVRFEVKGESVAGRLWEPEGAPRGQIVLVHGLLSQGAEYADAGERLARRGWRAFAVDQRGFGASGGPRGLISEERAVADTLGAVSWLRKDLPDAPVGIVGHSMGAAVALGALARDPTVGAGVLAAPMSTIPAELAPAEFQMYKALGGLSRLKARLGLGPLVVPYKYDYDRLFKDPQAARRAREQGFLVRSLSLSNYDALVGMDSARAARRVRQPVLVVLADEDRAVKRENSLAVYEALAGPKELATLACGHSMFGDCEAESAAAHVDRWMGLHLAPR